MNAIIATTPLEMQDAQQTTQRWVDAKLQDAKRELSLAEQVFNSLQAAHVRVQPAQAQIRKARRRITFYEKVKAALDAGYYIIPPFPVQLFAIRTDRASPSPERTERDWGREHTPRLLPVGEGKYVSAETDRYVVDTIKRKNAAGNEYEVKIYENGDDWRDVDLPIRAMKPQVIEATGKALGQRIFDALGIAPAYRNSDPIIIGHIKRPDERGEIAFFVAWWLDQTDL